MLKINMGTEIYTLDVITVRKLNQTMKFKAKFEALQETSAVEGANEGAVIDAMIDYLVDIFSIRKGEEVKYAFTADDLLDNMPLIELQSNFDYVINGVLAVFAGEEPEKK